MTKILIYFTLILTGAFGWSLSHPKNQAALIPEIALCHSQATDMVAFLDDPDFASFHPSPLPWILWRWVK
jgi:hypothetical protein